MRTFGFALIAAASALAINARAASFEWGVHDTLGVGGNMTPAGAVEDSYLASFTEPVSFNTPVSNNINQSLGIEDGMVTLYTEGGAVDLALGGFAFDDKSREISNAFGAQSAGDDHDLVTAEGVGTHGGLHYVLLSGLGVVGFLTLRRGSGNYSS